LARLLLIIRSKKVAAKQQGGDRMMDLEIIDKDFYTMDTLNGRNAETVEIWERETMRTVRVKNANSGRANFTATGRSPKLIIDDAFEQTKVFISKARSETNEVSSILREVMGSKGNK
jgi:hypothetical protein